LFINTTISLSIDGILIVLEKCSIFTSEFKTSENKIISLKSILCSSHQSVGSSSHQSVGSSSHHSVDSSSHHSVGSSSHPSSSVISVSGSIGSCISSA
jgi:hypothetical protein